MHMQQVARCPTAFPAGCFWYGDKHHGSRRPPKWIDAIIKEDTETTDKCDKDYQPDKDHQPDEDQPVIKEQTQVGNETNGTMINLRMSSNWNVRSQAIR